MNKKDSIEKLFQDKLSGYEAVPHQDLWPEIESALQEKKKKRRIVPIWWWVSGVASLFVIGFLEYQSIGNQQNNPATENGITLSHPQNQDTTNAVVKSNGKENATETIQTNPKITPLEAESELGVKKQDYLVSSEQKTQEQNTKETKLFKATNKLASNTPEKGKKASKVTSQPNLENNRATNATPTGIASTVVSKKPEQNTNSDYKVTPDLKRNNTIDSDKIAMKNQDNIVEKGDISTKKEEAVANTNSSKTMEELLNEKEEKDTQKMKKNRWQVAPNLAPVYFGSFADGSPLDDMLAENTKSFNTSMSYGVSVGYEVNDRLKVRTGVHVLSVNYDTEGIVFYQETNAKMMKNIDPTALGSMIQIKPLMNVSTQWDKMASERFDGVLNQKMGYLEVPVELSYRVWGQKFRIDAIGGVSTFFLNQNEIFLTSEGMNVKLGSATNLNRVHFSSNIGLSFNYPILRNFEARFEPVFKYQFNTFSSDATAFKPYIFGIYSGLSYRF